MTATALLCLGLLAPGEALAEAQWVDAHRLVLDGDCGEWATGEPDVEIRWAELALDPLGFGAFQSAGRFRSPSPTGATARPVSALEVDARGFLYAASAEDPDDDAGPFRSAVYRIGRVSEVSGAPRVELFREPQLLGTLDGLKVEADDPNPLELQPIALKKR